MTTTRHVQRCRRPPGAPVRDARPAVRVGQARHLALSGHGNPAVFRALLRLCRLSGQPSGSFRLRPSVSLEAVGRAEYDGADLQQLHDGLGGPRRAIGPPAMAGRAAGRHARSAASASWASSSSSTRTSGRKGCWPAQPYQPEGAAAGRRSFPEPRQPRRQAAPPSRGGTPQPDPTAGPIDDRAGGDRQAGNLARSGSPKGPTAGHGSGPSRTTCKCSSAFIS